MASLHEPDPRGIKSHQDEKFGSSQFNFKNLFISFHIYCGLRLHPLFQKLWKFSRWGQSGRLAVACKSEFTTVRQRKAANSSSSRPLRCLNPKESAAGKYGTVAHWQADPNFQYSDLEYRMASPLSLFL